MAPFHPVTIPVYIGYDPRQPAAFTALVQSIVSQCSMPVSIHPLVIDTLPVKRGASRPSPTAGF
jgi:hypothetical protein